MVTCRPGPYFHQKTMASEYTKKLITRSLIRQANENMIRGSNRRADLSPAARALMPTRAQIVEAGNKAMARMHEEERRSAAA